MVVNLGDFFEHTTNKKLKATNHRVMDIGVERYSQPFFLDPRSSTSVPSNILNTAEEQTQPPIVYGKWLANRMKRFGEWKNFDVAEEEKGIAQEAQ